MCFVGRTFGCGPCALCAEPSGAALVLCAPNLRVRPLCFVGRSGLCCGRDRMLPWQRRRRALRALPEKDAPDGQMRARALALQASQVAASPGVISRAAISRAAISRAAISRAAISRAAISRAAISRAAISRAVTSRAATGPGASRAVTSRAATGPGASRAAISRAAISPVVTSPEFRGSPMTSPARRSIAG